jgi:membrane protease YdiL (CAAX protease family)
MATARNKGPRALTGFKGYLAGSRDLFTSFVLVLPLFVLYQVGILATGGVRNGVDFMTDALMALLGGSVVNYLAFNGVVLLAFAGALVTLRKRSGFDARYVPWMLLESLVYALLFSTTIVLMMRALHLDALLATGGSKLELGLLGKVVMSVGAGLYEEIVFRLILMGGLFAMATRVLGFHRFLAGFLAVVTSSVIFSAVHHLGPLGEAFTLSAFTYRIFAGIVLAVIFQTRGFAIAAYTHAFYDVLVMVFKDG